MTNLYNKKNNEQNYLLIVFYYVSTFFEVLSGRLDHLGHQGR